MCGRAEAPLPKKIEKGTNTRERLGLTWKILSSRKPGHFN
jgi:hypothetical protein